MDLSEESEMARALQLLQSLDLPQLLRDAESPLQPPTRSRPNLTPYSTAEDAELAEQKQESSSVPSSLSRPVSPPSPTKRTPVGDVPALTISLTGLSAFASPKRARVFYAKPDDPSKRLYNFGLLIRRRFREAGFITETRPLVLHATVANMRYAVQAHGGRTSKGKKWARGKDRWQQGMIDASEIVRRFDTCGGRVEEARSSQTERPVADEQVGPVEEEQDGEKGEDIEYEASRRYGDREEVDKRENSEKGEQYLWAKDISIDRLAICKMGADKSDDEILGLIYPPVGEKYIFI